MRPLADLPNTEGYRFIGVRWDLSHVPCVVRRREDGMHVVHGEDFEALLGWMEYATEDDE